jgi:hypothetical protein
MPWHEALSNINSRFCRTHLIIGMIFAKLKKEA